MKRIGVLGIALAMLWGAFAHSGEGIGRYRYVRTLAPLDAQRSGPGVFQLDRLLYGRLDDLANGLKLFDSNGAMQPLTIRRAKVAECPPPPEVPLKLAGERYDNGNPTTGMVLANPERKELSGIEIVHAERDFDKLVDVESSEDGESWVPVVQGAPFFSYESGLGIGNCRIPLPGGRSRFYRIGFRDYPAAEPSPGEKIQGIRILPQGSTYSRRRLKIDRIDGYGTGPRALVESERQASRTGFRSDVAEEAGDYRLLTLENAKCPVNGVRIESEQESYAWPVTVAVSRDGRKYEDVASGIVYRFQAGGQEFRNEWLEFPEQRPEFIRVTLNGTGGAGFRGGFRGPVYEGVVERDVPDMELYYNGKSGGAAEAASGDYRLGDEKLNPSYDPDGINYMRWGLGTGLVLLAVILAFVMYRGFRSMEP